MGIVDGTVHTILNQLFFLQKEFKHAFFKLCMTLLVLLHIPDVEITLSNTNTMYDQGLFRISYKV